MTDFGLVAFHSTHAAIAAEKALCGRFAVLVRPTPRALSVSCGISLRFAAADLGELAAALAKLLPEGGYQLYEHFVE